MPTSVNESHACLMCGADTEDNIYVPDILADVHGEWLCPRCVDECTEICHHCGQRVMPQYVFRRDPGDPPICINCLKSMTLLNDHVLGYLEEHKVQLPLHDLGEPDPIYIGYEIEYIDEQLIVERCKHYPMVYDPMSLPQRLFDALKDFNLLDYVKSTLDYSVSGELVTAPMSVEFLVSEAGTEVLRQIEKALKLCGAVTDKTTCARWRHKGKSEKCYAGGHIHVSCTDGEIAMQIARFISLTQEYWHAISGRRDISPWANFTPVSVSGIVNTDHHSAVSSDKNTVEFRFWGATGLANVLLDRGLLCADIVKYISAPNIKKLTSYSSAYADSILKDFLAKRKIF